MRRYKRLGLLVLLAVVLGTATGSGDRVVRDPTPIPEPEKAPPEPKLVLWTASEGVAAALADLSTVPEFDRLFQRYVFVPDGNMRTVRNVSWTINNWSRAPIIYLPTVLASGHLVRYDVRRYARDADDAVEILQVLEDFQYDSNFSLNITQDMLLFAEQCGVQLPHKVDENVVVLRLPSPGTDVAKLEQLQGLSRSFAPIVSARYFLSRSRGTIKSKNKVFDTLFGGRYYDLRGIKKSPNKGQTDQDFFFEQFLGVGNFKGKLDARQLFDSLQSDHRYLILNSDVAGRKNRIIVDYPTLANYEGGMLTLDVQDENVDVSGQALANLADGELKFDAQEAIFPDSKKMPMQILWNGEGALQDEAPFNVVAARNHPNPFTTRLHGADCIDCHAANGSDMWLPIHNDALDLVGLKLGQADVFGDFHRNKSGRQRGSFDYANRLAGQYAGQDVRERLQRLRTDFMTATLNACGGMFEGSDGSQADVGKLNAQWLVKQYARENYTPVGAEEALEDLGLEKGTHYDPKKVKLPDGRQVDGALATLQALLLPDDRNPAANGFVTESGAVAVLRAGKKLTPPEWFFIRPFVAERTRAGVEVLRKAAREKEGQK